MKFTAAACNLTSLLITFVATSTSLPQGPSSPASLNGLLSRGDYHSPIGLVPPKNCPESAPSTIIKTSPNANSRNGRQTRPKACSHDSKGIFIHAVDFWAGGRPTRSSSRPVKLSNWCGLSRRPNSPPKPSGSWKLASDMGMRPSGPTRLLLLILERGLGLRLWAPSIIFNGSRRRMSVCRGGLKRYGEFVLVSLFGGARCWLTYCNRRRILLVRGGVFGVGFYCPRLKSFILYGF